MATFKNPWEDARFLQWDRGTTQEQGWDFAPTTQPLVWMDRVFQGQTATRCNLLKESQQSTGMVWLNKPVAQL